jgi:secretion/DNA translocation related TadE-like protein
VEHGSASVLGAALIAVLLAITIAGGAVGAAIIGRHRAQAGADLAALAGAAAVPAGTGAACARAAGVARTMRTDPTDCRLDDLDLVVTVEIAVRLGRWTLGSARGAARAGPVASDPG